MIEAIATPSTLNNSTFCLGAYVYMNPGQESSWPWLATQAQGFEMYEFISVTFFYIPRVGSNSNGEIILSPDPDPNDEVAVDEQTAFGLPYAAFGGVTQTVSKKCPIRLMAGATKRKYIRFGNSNFSGLPDNLNDYDYGSFAVYLSGVAAATGLGRLFATYTCKLLSLANLIHNLQHISTAQI